jgi:hypothetical protein
VAYLHRLNVEPLMKDATTVDDLPGPVVSLTGVIDKGYDFVRGAGAAFTAVLEGSVAGLSWTTIANLNASAQAAIGAHFNYVRINGSAEGALGTGTVCRVAGKEIDR